MAPTDIYKLLDIDIEQTENNEDKYIEIQRNVDADADEMDFENIFCCCFCSSLMSSKLCHKFFWT